VTPEHSHLNGTRRFIRGHQLTDQKWDACSSGLNHEEIVLVKHFITKTDLIKQRID